jgi:hypothetical protein
MVGKIPHLTIIQFEIAVVDSLVKMPLPLTGHQLWDYK